MNDSGVRDCTWLPAPARPALPGDAVHAWCISLDPPPACIERLAQTLSPDERARADRFHFERDQRRFKVARGTLRTILGLYLDVEATCLRFGYTAHGKPYLLYPQGQALCFNLAHSCELALCAFTCGREVGVDLEYIRPMPDAEEIATRFFSSPESAVLRALPPSQRLEAFFNCWTRKEAYVKAIGEGLSIPLDQFQVSLTPGEPARLLHVEGKPAELARWTPLALRPTPTYIAALMVEGAGWQLACWQYID